MWMSYLNIMIYNILDGVEISQVTPTISILIFSFLLCIFMLWQPWKRTALPPGPRGLPIVGYLPYMEANFLQQWAELARQYGPIYKMQMGNKLWVVVSSPSIAKELIRDQDMIFTNSDPTVALNILSRGGLDDSTLASPGSQWRNTRKIFVQELLRKSNIDANYELRKVELRKAIKLLSSKVGKPIDVGQFMRTISLDVLMSVVWGRSIEAEELRKVSSEFNAFLQKFVDLMRKPNISDHFPLIARFDIQGIAKESKAVFQSLDEILDSIIDRSMEKLEAKAGDTIKDFIQLLLELRESEGYGPAFGKTEIKSILRGFVFGATDTTSTTAKLVMTQLVHNRELMQKVQKELEDVVGLNNIIEEFHLPKLRYLDAVIKETLRLNPTVPLIGRSPTQTCTLAGYTIPKKAKVNINVWAIQRDPQLWENPLNFQPERFLNEPDKWDFWGKDLQYIPFGSGRRVCPGIPLAERVFKYTVASMLHSFDWQPTETVDLAKTWIYRKKALLAIPTKRLSDSGLYT